MPVDWTDDTDSRVHVIATILADLRGIARLGTGLLRGSIAVPYLGRARPPAGSPRAGVTAGPAGLRRQLAWFAVVGAVSTAAYIALYLLLRNALPAQLANALSLLDAARPPRAAKRRRRSP